MCADFPPNSPAPLEGYLPVEGAELYYRVVGEGRPILVLHGGPSFDHTYLLPDMDRLADGYRLIYYDQRGRGKSTGEPQDISIRSEIEDVEALRQHFGLDAVAVLGHSWGGLLGLLYAIDYPERVSHLILMNTSPATYADNLRGQEHRKTLRAVHQAELDRFEASAAYQAGDRQVVGDLCRLEFSTTIKQPEHVQRLNMSFSSSTSEGILRAREIGEKMYQETLDLPDFNPLPKLSQFHNPTLLIHSDYDFFPSDTITPIAEAISGAQWVMLKDCGHFTYLECPDQVRQAIDDFFASS